jgi:hypothetical protein
MSRDSKVEAELHAWGRKFRSAVDTSFHWLLAEGYVACDHSAADLDEIRDARFICRYVQRSTAIEVVLSALTLQVMVIRMDYLEPAACERTERPQQVVGLDTWTMANGPVAPPPLPWMKRQTIFEDLQRPRSRYMKEAARDLEAVVDFMAQRLRNSKLADVSG